MRARSNSKPEEEADEDDELLPLAPSSTAPPANALPLAPVAIGYVLCSSLLMVLNKLALQAFPYPSTLMGLQFISATGTVRALAAAGKLDAAPFIWSQAVKFLLVPFVFELAIFTNIKLLQTSNVETAIVFRTLVPVITSYADYSCMGREAPSRQSATGLFIVCVGALVFAQASPRGIKLDTWLWAVAYMTILAFEMVYVKYVLESLPMSTWTRVYYNNLIALFFWPPFLLIGAEYAKLSEALLALTELRVAALVAASCVVGVGISFTGFGFRNLVTATTFTVVGVMNKVLTVLLSVLFVSSAPTSLLSFAGLMGCIGGGTMYRQAPPRSDHYGSSRG